MKRERIVLAFVPHAKVATTAFELREQTLSDFLASAPSRVNWLVASDVDQSRTALIFDGNNDLSWAARRCDKAHGLPDNVDASAVYTICRLAFAGSGPMAASDIIGKLCEPLVAHGASAILVTLASAEIIRAFLDAGFRILGAEHKTRIKPGFWLPNLLSSPLPPAIVLGRPNPNMLAQLRALGRYGVRVYCVVNRGEPAVIARVSRYAAGVFDVRRGADRDVIDAIKSVARITDSKPVLFFGGDLDITLTARIWQSICDHVIAVSDPLRAEFLNAKTEQGARVSAAGIRVPQGGGIRTLQDLEHLCATLQFPVICRPVELASRGTFADKIIIADTPAEMRKRLQPLVADEKSWILAQEYIPGPDESLLFALACCSEGGVVSAIVTGRKLCQYPPGLMCRGEAAEDLELRKLATSAFQALGLEGVVGIEFKRHEVTGELYYIEANFRPENIIAVTEGAGLNVLLMAFLQSIGQGALMWPLKMQPALWRDLSMELVGWAAGRFPWRKGLSGVPARKHVGALWAADDPFPAAAWHLSKVFRLFAKMQSNLRSKIFGSANLRSGRAVR